MDPKYIVITDMLIRPSLLQKLGQCEQSIHKERHRYPKIQTVGSKALVSAGGEYP